MFQSALIVAFLNVYIPMLLGEVVNVLANQRNNPSPNFIEQIQAPALKLFGLYVAQVNYFIMFNSR